MHNFSSTINHGVLKGTQFVNYILDIPGLRDLLEAAGSKHNHLCPRIVLGVRMGLAGIQHLDPSANAADKSLLTILETDGCFVSGIETVTGTAVNHRTMQIIDYGKIAATFVAVKTGKAIRVAPFPNIREKAAAAVSEIEKRRYFAMLIGYQTLPVEELLSIHPVGLRTPVQDLISKPRIRVICDLCGEEIINEREQFRGSQTLCSSCCEPGYYFPETNY